MYRSRFEKKFANHLKDLGVKFKYEKTKLRYEMPARKSNYTPDFEVQLGGKQTFFETKGRWTAQDRKKHLLLKRQLKDVRIILVFMNPKVKIYKGSKTTYADWADKNNIEWCTVEGALKQLRSK